MRITTTEGLLFSAKLSAAKSSDPSTQTGAVIVSPGGTLRSTGYNQFPRWMSKPYAGMSREEKYSRIVHAEIDALINAIGSGVPLDGCTLATWPFMPCERCCVQMIHAGITKIVAPVAPLDKLSRWEAIFEKTRLYCKETGVELIEVADAEI